MLRFAQRYAAFVLAYWAASVGVYFLCFGSVANISTSFLESAAGLFNARVVLALTGISILILVAGRGRYDFRKLLPVLIIALAQIPFFSAFHMNKVCIPEIVAFWADPAFADLDRALHGGQDAFRLYHGVLGGIIPESLIVTVYFPVWVAVAYIYPAVIAAIEKDETRAIRHIRLHAVIWILLGNLMATVFSSAGPVFFELVTGRGDFDYVNAFLREDRAVFAGVIELQNKLWIEHSGGALGTGISAFPSLHVGAAMLPLLWLVDRFGWRGLIGAVFPLLIQYGSVVTGFHYAVDGYASAAIACLCLVVLRQMQAGRVSGAGEPARGR